MRSAGRSSPTSTRITSRTTPVTTAACVPLPQMSPIETNHRLRRTGKTS